MNLESMKPSLGSNAWVAPNASVIGDVKLGDKASVWYGSSIRGDNGPVVIGAGSNVQDGCTIGGIITQFPKRLPTTVGSQVTIGHGATLSGCTVEDGCLIGMGATILPGSKIEKGSMVAAGAIVPMDTTVPSGELWGGNPAKQLRTLKQPEKDFLPESASKYVELAGEHRAEVAPAATKVSG